MALGCDILDDAALKIALPEVNQASGSFFASYPVVYVGFHHKLVAQVIPQAEVHSVIISLTFWRRGRWVNIPRIVAYWPCWTWDDGI